MKIAVMTWFHYNHYGTVLQAAALTRALRRMGHEVDMIDYFPGNRFMRLPTGPLRKELLRQFRQKHAIIRDPEITTQISGEAFDAFRSRELTFSDYCANRTDLERLNDLYDAFICGSDRIWLSTNFDSHYYLDFVHDPERMIAYAPTIIDSENIDPYVRKQMGDLIARFVHLSVREESGRKYLLDAFGKQTQELADPTLLIDAEEWCAHLDAKKEAEEEANAGKEAGQNEAAKEETEQAAKEEAVYNEPDDSAEEAEIHAAAETEEAVIYAADNIVAADDKTEDSGEEDDRSASENTVNTVNTDTVGDETAGEAFHEKTQEYTGSKTASSEEAAPEASEMVDPQKEGYLLAFFSGEGANGNWDAAEKLAARLQLSVKVIPLHQSDLRRKGAVQEAVSPEQFVAYIRDASYVCTDSYQTVLFALQFHKEFCCFERFNNPAAPGLNERLHHILSAVALKPRMYQIDAPLEQYLEKIDYLPVDYKLDALKIKSKEFLEKSLAAVEAHVNASATPPRHILQGYTLCSGCGACAVVCGQDAIRIAQDENGFLRAFVEEAKCMRCQACRSVCAFQGPSRGRSIAESKLLSYADEVKEHRIKSSGGGLASRLAKVLHDVGYGIVGCVGGENGAGARHILISKYDDPIMLEKLQGSKYVQSAFAPVLTEMLAYEGPLAVFGLPCQISAARRILKDKNDVKYIELVCSGVPSQLLYEKYKRSVCGKNKLEPESFALTVRYKQVPQVGSYVCVSDGNTEKVIPKKKDGFSRIMASGQYYGEACYDCRWRDKSEADLRIGDYQDEGYASQAQQSESSVFCLSDAGKEMLDQLMIAGYWEGLHKRDIVEFLSRHPGENPPKPVFYDEICEKFRDDKVSLNKILNEYVKACEKRKRWERF